MVSLQNKKTGYFLKKMLPLIQIDQEFVVAEIIGAVNRSLTSGHSGNILKNEKTFQFKIRGKSQNIMVKNFWLKRRSLIPYYMK